MCWQCTAWHALGGQRQRRGRAGAAHAGKPTRLGATPASAALQAGRPIVHIDAMLAIATRLLVRDGRHTAACWLWEPGRSLPCEPSSRPCTAEELLMISEDVFRNAHIEAWARCGELCSPTRERAFHKSKLALHGTLLICAALVHVLLAACPYSKSTRVNLHDRTIAACLPMMMHLAPPSTSARVREPPQRLLFRAAVASACEGTCRTGTHDTLGARMGALLLRLARKGLGPLRAQNA